jgi:hypothetical protein
VRCQRSSPEICSEARSAGHLNVVGGLQIFIVRRQ